MILRGIRQLLTLIVVLTGLAALAALLYWKFGGVTAHRAWSLVFYAAGALVVVFGLLTSGAERRAYGMAPVGLMRRFNVTPQERALNPTGAIVVGGLALLVLGGVFDTVL